MTKFRKFIKYSLPYYFSLNNLIINFKFFPFKQAIKLPILLNKNVYLKSLSGQIELEEYRQGVVKIGFGDISIFDKRTSKTILHIDGLLKIKGQVDIGHGSKISINKGAVLSLGDKFKISAESSIVVLNKITIGDNFLMSWDSLIMDSDLHTIYDDGVKQLRDVPITIGDNVWIGCRSTVLKGIVLEGDQLVGANSVVTKSFKERDIVIAGNPARLVKHNVKWKR